MKYDVTTQKIIDGSVMIHHTMIDGNNAIEHTFVLEVIENPIECWLEAWRNNISGGGNTYYWIGKFQDIWIHKINGVEGKTGPTGPAGASVMGPTGPTGPSGVSDKTAKYVLEDPQSLTSSAWDKVLLSTTLSDETLGGFYLGNNEVECLFDGIVQIHGMVIFDMSNDVNEDIGIRLTKNGTEIQGAINIDKTTKDAGYYTYHVNTIVMVEDRDKISLQAYVSDNTYITIDASNTPSSYATTVHAALHIYKIA
jgi:hypothetical protein